MCLGLSACAMFEIDKTQYRTTNAGPGVQQFYAERQQLKFSEAKQELGLANTRELTQEEVMQIYKRVELHRLESQLDNKTDRQQYFTLKPYFKSDQERIDFLKLPGQYARQNYAATRGIAALETNFDSTTNNLIENNDIAKGMSMSAVQQSWGEPELKETAGNPMYGHQAWHYRKMVSTDSGYSEQTRIIYFESGRVSGWQTF